MHISTLGIIAGGYSGEAEVSYRSSATLMDQLKDTPWEVVLITLTKEAWTAHWKNKKIEVDKNDFSFKTPEGNHKIDYAYIIIHGTPGEDGRLQGYLDMLDIPYSTGDPLNMSLTFNKGATQRSLKARGIQVSDFVQVRKGEAINKDAIITAVGLPCFVKPAEAGSSLGASKVKTMEDLLPALDKVFHVDDEAMIERYLVGRELTCGVIRYKGKVMALPITEIISSNEFFDYAAKYDPTAAQEITPAEIGEEATGHCQAIAKDIYGMLNCKGIIRIDFFLCGTELFVVEVNTVPGFSKESIVPQQLRAAGLSIKEVLMDIIETTSTKA
jgi:D-alanine-D-alanine ligase